MSNPVKKLLERFFSGSFIYQALAGGRRYYKIRQTGYYKPGDFLFMGANVRIDAGVSIAAPERLHIGDNTGICEGCYINAVGGCHIGRGCQIAADAIILTTEHVYSGAETLPHGLVRFIKPVYIEDYVWIGTRVSVVPGVRIGEGAIVAMGSVVAQDVPPRAIVMGNPAKVVMFRSEEEYLRLKASGNVIDPFAELPVLKIPPVTMRKYKDVLPALGFDVSDGCRDFYYDKSEPKGKRLKKGSFGGIS